jgi:hypothetical protein
MTSLGKRRRDLSCFDEPMKFKVSATWVQGQAPSPNHGGGMGAVMVSQDVVMHDAWPPAQVNTERYCSAAPVATFTVVPRAVDPPLSLFARSPLQALPAVPAPNNWVYLQPAPAPVQKCYPPPVPIRAAAAGVPRYHFDPVPYRPRRKSFRELAVQKFKQALPPLTAVVALVSWAAVLLTSENPQAWLPW